MLKVENLSKSFNDHLVLDNINLEVADGAIFALVGPNGAGKTTLIRSLLGIVLPDSGRVMLDDGDLLATPSLKERVAYIPEVHHFYPDFTGEKLAKLYRLTYKSWDEDRYEELKRAFKLPLDKRFKHLSKGMKTQIAFLLNLAIKPDLMILDEPTSGLDPFVRKRILTMIVDQVASSNTKVIISSHNLLELERICDGFAILDKGRVVLSEQVDTLKQTVHKLQVAFRGELPEQVANHPGLLSTTQTGKVYTLVVKDTELLEIIKNSGPLLFEQLDISIEEIFMSELGGYQDEN